MSDGDGGTAARTDATDSGDSASGAIVVLHYPARETAPSGGDRHRVTGVAAAETEWGDRHRVTGVAAAETEWGDLNRVVVTYTDGTTETFAATGLTIERVLPDEE